MKFTPFFLLSLLSLFLFTQCNDAEIPTNGIISGALEKDIVLNTSITDLLEDEDPIALYVDSILQGYINAEFISTGLQNFHIDSDDKADFSFDIIDLQEFNSQALPPYYDHLAARIHPKCVELLDNSTYGYPDALNHDDLINDNHHWSQDENYVLGTFLEAGQFKGAGEKYLGMRIPDADGSYNYGWIKVYCSAKNDTLKVIQYAYNSNPDSPIKAGQLE